MSSSISFPVRVLTLGGVSCGDLREGQATCLMSILRCWWQEGSRDRNWSAVSREEDMVKVGLEVGCGEVVRNGGSGSGGLVSLGPCVSVSNGLAGGAVAVV
jgi:hypothetical protein